MKVLADTALRGAPVTVEQCLQMLDELSGRRLFFGMRGSGPLDRETLAELICGLSRLAMAEAEVADLELNPVLVHGQGQGCPAVDMRGTRQA